MIEELKERLGEPISFQTLLLDYITQNFDDENNEQYKNLVEFINNHNIRTSKSKIIQLLRILSQLTGSHFRGHDLLRKIEKILLELINDINTLITSISELFNIFKYNKTILLFLLKNIEQLNSNPRNKELFLLHILESDDKELFQFFYPELRELSTLEQESELVESGFNLIKFKEEYNEKIKEFKLEKFITENDKNIELFNIRRNQGENETKIAQLIRKDDLTEFLEYINTNKIKINSKIRSDSPFETNFYLLDREPILLEYSAFTGSLQIFNYLIQNIKKEEVKPKIFSYAVHGSNYEIIHQLESFFSLTELNKESNKLIPNLKDCFLESIKCHHNDIALYIQATYLKEVNVKYIETSINACNFVLILNAIELEQNNHLLEDKKEIQNIFNCFCANGYIDFVQFFLDQKDLIDINAKESIRYYLLHFFFLFI